jgi:hypothetical protein
MYLAPNKAREYQVVKRHGRWFAKTLGRFGGSYSSQRCAIQGALDRAQKCAQAGTPAIVSVFDKHRVSELLQSFGQDAYIPNGSCRAAIVSSGDRA